MYIICDNGDNRLMTELEIAEQKKFIQDVEAIKQARELEEISNAAAKQALLDRLGITADEARLLLS